MMRTFLLLALTSLMILDVVIIMKGNSPKSDLFLSHDYMFVNNVIKFQEQAVQSSSIIRS